MPLYGPSVSVLHHVSHEPLGSDEIMNVNATRLTTGVLPDARLSINVLKHTGGYPGGATNFLRADGIFSVPSNGSGTVGLHQITHQIGGSDVIQNNAWTNQPNVFTQKQTITDASPIFEFNATGYAANARRTSLYGGPDFVIRHFADNGDLQVGIILLTRDGTTYLNTLEVTGNAVIDGSILVIGTGGNVACKDQANTFTQTQTIAAGGLIVNAGGASITGNTIVNNLIVNDGSISVTAGVNGHVQCTGPIYPGRLDNGWTTQGTWYLASHNSYGLYSNTGLYLAGGLWSGTHVLAGTDFFEKGRGIPLGNWITAAAPAVWTDSGSITLGTLSTNSYTLIGNTMIWRFQAESMIITGSPTIIYFAIPVGCTNYGFSTGSGILYTGDVGPIGDRIYSSPGTTYVSFQKVNMTTMTGFVHLYFSITLQIG